MSALIESAHQRLAELDAVVIASARKKVEATLKAAGLTFGQVFPAAAQAHSVAGSRKKAGGVKRAASHKARLPAKYVNPKNSKQTWSGHGKRPQWFVAATKGGVKPESLQIKK